MEDFIIKTYINHKGDNFRMEYVNGYVIPMIKKFINKEVKDLDQLKFKNYAPIWDTRNNTVVKDILEQLLKVKLSGVVKRDKVILQNYLNEL